MNGQQTRVLIETIIEEVDFLRACMEAGGNHEHAFWLCIDGDELTAASDALEASAERIRRELEGNAGS